MFEITTQLTVCEKSTGPLITTPEQCASYLSSIEDLAQEAFVIITLNTKNRAISTPIEEAEKLMHGMPNPPVIKYGLSQAAYFPTLDLVQMPKQAWFCEDQQFYATLFHELAHSTGHENRLARKGITAPCAFGADPYAKEELVAEMTSVFLCNHCGILPYIEANSASYLGGWLKRLHEDHTLLISSGSQAQRAFDYIVGPQDDDSQEATSDKSEVAVSRSREPIHQKGGISC